MRACVRVWCCTGEKGKKGKGGGRDRTCNERTNAQTQMIKCMELTVNKGCICIKDIVFYLLYLCNFSLNLILFPTQKTLPWYKLEVLRSSATGETRKMSCLKIFLGNVAFSLGMTKWASKSSITFLALWYASDYNGYPGQAAMYACH